LKSQQIIKVGRNVGADLAKLARDFPDFKVPVKHRKKFVGVVELGAFAKAKNAVSSGTASLATIAAAALGVNLSKEIRSSEWSAPQLSAEQQQYAALDALVALEIWNTLKNQKTQGLPLKSASPVGQTISVYEREQEVARGVIVSQPRQFAIKQGTSKDSTLKINVSTTRTRVLIKVDKILAPKFVLTHHQQTLEDLWTQGGNTSFEAVVSLTSLRTCSQSEAKAPDTGSLPPMAPEYDSNITVIRPPVETTTHSGPSTDEDADGDSDSDDDDDPSPADPDDIPPEDPLAEFAYVQPENATNYPSRILADVFHEMDKVGRTISKKHSLHHRFATAFSDTMLVPDKNDKAKVEEYLNKKGMNWDQVRRSSPGWLWKRVRRYIPEKSLLHRILKEFFDCWGPIKCTTTGQKLFSAESWKKANGVLHDVQKGWISDPAGIPLYTVRGHDRNGLAIYHCIRGTNSVEGAVHNPIRRCFASLNASVELADSLIADFRHRHNLDVGTVHKTGSHYFGHYDPWLEHEILKLRGDIRWTSKPAIGPVLLDTDPLKFAPTDEQFGITSIPNTVRIQCDFNGPEVLDPQSQSENVSLSLSHIYPVQLLLSKLKGKRKDAYSYLAHAQKVKFAVTPVHTKDEFKLFHQEVSVGGNWNNPHGQPNFDRMATWWSAKANGISIFYKLPEYLATHYKKWLEHRHEGQTMVASHVQRRPHETRIRSKRHVAHVLNAISHSHPAQPAVTLSQNDPSAASQGSTAQYPPLGGESTSSTETGSEQVQSIENQFIAESPSPVQLNLIPFQSMSATFALPPQPQLQVSRFVSWTGSGSTQGNGMVRGTRKPRRCKICIEAGREGYRCPGKDNRAKCSFI
jgi:hypothetical protein